MFPPDSDSAKLETLLRSREKTVAMLAPSFIIDFNYPEIIIKLRRIGFDKVVELTFGAKMVNKCYWETLQNNPDKSLISSPCSTLVPLVLRQYPHLKENLFPIVSPTIATARILKKYYPNHKNVFIGPCLTKKQEIKEFPEDVCLALTFKELGSYFEAYPVDEKVDPKIPEEGEFDKFYNDYTKIYPLAGALAKTMHANEILRPDQFVIEDGIEKEVQCLNDFEKNKNKIRFYDLLSCRGGCIGGPGIASPDSIEKRHEKVEEYRRKAPRIEEKDEEKDKIGKIEDAAGIDFSRHF